MSPRTVTEDVLLEPPLLRAGDELGVAVRRLVESRLPALPVVDDDERYVGIFGEREFLAALFPGWVGQLRYAGFLSRSLDDVLEKRDAARHEPVERHMTTEHVDVGPDFSDVGVAEVFLHHRVLVVPVVEDGRVLGLLTRADFFRRLAERFGEGG